MIFQADLLYKKGGTHTESKRLWVDIVEAFLSMDASLGVCTLPSPLIKISLENRPMGGALSYHPGDVHGRCAVQVGAHMEIDTGVQI